MNWYKQAKFITSESAKCGHCLGQLNVVGMSINDYHHFPIGQDWSCGCGKSKIWTNSIREPKYFIEVLDDLHDKYYQGVCNDKFCGHCHGRIDVLENGYEIPGDPQRMDRYGCRRCSENQMLLMDGYKELREGQDGSILEWYKSNLEKLKQMVQQ